MKNCLWLLLACLFLTGCATSTVEKRKQERYGAYASLAPEFKSAVDQGQIQVGMPMDAVYIAWGKPAQVLQSSSAQGTTTTWVYHGSQLQAYHYWTYYGYRAHGYYWGQPYLATDYYSHEYIRAEVVFENGLVKEWRTWPAPGY